MAEFRFEREGAPPVIVEAGSRREAIAKFQAAMGGGGPTPDADPDAAAADPTPSLPQQPGSPLLSTRNLRPVVVGSGAALGALAAAPGGVTTPLGLTGGAMIGSTVADTLTEMGRAAGLVSPEGPIFDNTPGGNEGGARGVIGRALGEGALEAAGAGVPQAARTAFEAGRRSLVKVGDEGARILLKAQNLGVGVGAEVVTERGALKSFRNVMGRFPFVGGIFNKADDTRSVELTNALDKILRAVGPERAAPEVGVALREGASSRFNHLKMVAAKAYDSAFKQADDVGATVGVDSFRDALDRVTVELGTMRPQIREVKETGLLDALGRPLKEETTRAMRRVEASTLEDFIGELRQVEGPLSLKQYQELRFDLQKVIDAEEGVRKARALDLKTALDEDLGSLSDPEVLASFQSANALWGKMRALFETPTGKRFGRVNQNEFRGAELDTRGTVNEDELFNVVFNSKSPQALRELRSIVGDEPFRQAARRHLEDAVQTAVEQSRTGDLTMNVDRLRKSLGLTGARSSQQKATDLILKQTGVDPAALREFVDVMEAISAQGRVNISAFLARRAGLGGARGVTKVLQPFKSSGSSGAAGTGGGAAGAGAILSPVRAAIGAIGFFMGNRQFAKFLTDPKKLKLVTDVLRPIPFEDGATSLGGLVSRKGVGGAARLAADVVDAPRFVGREAAGDSLRRITKGRAGPVSARQRQAVAEAVRAQKRSAAIRLMRIITREVSAGTLHFDPFARSGEVGSGPFGILGDSQGEGQ